MKRILTIANREYKSMVGTKAFLFTIIMMPLLMAGGTIVPPMLKKLQTTKPKKMVVIDQSGDILTALQAKAEERNAELDKPKDNAEAAFGDASPYQIEAFEGTEWDDNAKLELSDQVRERDIYAFIEIPANATKLGEQPQVNFYSEDAALSQARRWVGRRISEIVQTTRLTRADVDLSVVGQALIPVGIEGKGLLTKNESGQIEEPEEKDELLSLFIPFGLMMLMFLIIFLAAQPMLEAVLEEKSERIAEVLLGSVSAKQLLMGKLLGNVAGSLTVFIAYAAGGYALAAYNGWTDIIPFSIVPWFMIYQVLGVLFFSSIFMAIGSAVKQLKEAQSLLLPVWMLMFLPMFVLMNAIEDPNGTVPTALSFFPPSAPLMMMIRLSSGALIPPWQIAGSIIVMLVATFLVVAAAARIFQVGILWQGKTPKPGEVLKWLFKNPLVGS
ncbi:MAG: ABC transporter permease [Planctomycetaceae bacterium]